MCENISYFIDTKNKYEVDPYKEFDVICYRNKSDLRKQLSMKITNNKM